MAPKKKSAAGRPRAKTPRKAEGQDTVEAAELPLTKLLKMRMDQDVEYKGETVPAKCAIVDRVVTMATEEGDKWAINFIWDRIEGKPLQQMNIGGQVPNSLAELIQLGMEGKA